MGNKKLLRSEEDKMLAGICGGVANYFGKDSTLIRVLWVLISLFGPGILLYLVMWLIVPKSPGGTK